MAAVLRCAGRALRAVGARASRLWRLRRSAWIASMADLAMFYLDLVEETRARPRPSDRQLARRLARGRDPDPRPLALPQSRRSSRRPASGSRACRAATISSGGPKRRCATSITTSPSPTASWLLTPSDEQIDIDADAIASRWRSSAGSRAGSIPISRSGCTASSCRRWSCGARRQDHAAKAYAARCGTSGCPMRGS